MGKALPIVYCQKCGCAHEPGKHRARRPKLVPLVISIPLPEGVTLDPELGKQYAKGLAASFTETKAEPKDDRPRPVRRRAKRAAKKATKAKAKKKGIFNTVMNKGHVKKPAHPDGVAFTSIPMPEGLAERTIEGLAKAGAFDRGAYQRDYMKDKRAADKLGVSVKEFRARQKAAKSPDTRTPDDS